MKITENNEKKLIITILTKIGLNEENSEIVAEATVDADLKGFTSHGIGRFSQYIKGIENGNINLQGDITIEKETEAIALINGNSAFGQVVAYKAMQLAIKKAKRLGIAAVGTHNSNHFGVTGYYSDLAMKEDIVGIVTANTEPAIAPLGGREALIGTNPIAISIPSEKSYVGLDMATSASARGKLLEAQRKGEQIPENTALDKDGNPTTDPSEALKGSILPFGSHKGYGLAFMIEILTGPLVNAAFGKKVTGTADHSKKCTKGDLFIAIDPAKFVGTEKFKKETEEFLDDVRLSAPNTIVPGDLEVKKISSNKENGIPIDKKLYQNLKTICDNLDIELDDYLNM
ncbi:putative oxidoreductase YjmC [Methanobrevibacter cuticularis]|uniref:Putative oxidoreductase YjmC n=1 Tax=Methanobrevibacter cuticularis TaxID=47311 RepID=A0A166FHG7_9EURY|nr:L-sulfolactate dehydrogenase [Methanobrevibacter cuticularis]KZX17676.1 putative oxidoreductase YjmC [Methanobrevibacter cuticularis]